MKLTKMQIALIGIGLAIIVVIVLLFTGVIPGLRKNSQSSATGTLTIWGIYDTEKVFKDTLITDFVTANPGVKIAYSQKDPETYEQDLINALAAGVGPDIFMIKNTWLAKHADKMSPLPESALAVSTLATLFPDIVLHDVVANNKVYALPLYIDTLALFYNKTIFDNAGIAKPPTTWDEFTALIPKLRSFDNLGRLSRAAAAIGGSSKNINEATDLLSLILLQRGVKMTDAKVTRATFADGGLAPVEFYTDFASPRSSNYTWDASQHYSLDAFSEESAAMIFNYAYQIHTLKEKNPFLNFGISPMLQLKGASQQINFGNYLALTVSKKTSQPNLAWAFITAATLDPATNVKYLNAAGRTPALREVIAASVNDPDIGLFSRQALTATDWTKVDDTAVDESFTKMIELIINGQLPIDTALKQAETEVTAAIRRHVSQE